MKHASGVSLELFGFYTHTCVNPFIFSRRDRAIQFSVHLITFVLKIVRLSAFTFPGQTLSKDLKALTLLLTEISGNLFF